jgi:hypothetical protein
MFYEQPAVRSTVIPRNRHKSSKSGAALAKIRAPTQVFAGEWSSAKAAKETSVKGKYFLTIGSTSGPAQLVRTLTPVPCSGAKPIQALQLRYAKLRALSGGGRSVAKR